MTLDNLEKVSASLGAKAVLWELFSFNPPSLRLYVELCSTSQFLSEILINNPGMIDDLMDSLVVDRPQPASAIRAELSELCQGAEDLAPILLSFRNKEWLRIGTRDILGREPIRDVTRELADVAEAIVGQVARDRLDRRLERSGVPRRDSDGRRARWAILGLGKLGGREMNYHSDLDLVFLFDEDGEAHDEAGPIPNASFFADLARGVIRTLEGDCGIGPALPGRYPAPTLRPVRPTRLLARRLPRLLRANRPGLGTPRPDPFPRPLRARRPSAATSSKAIQETLTRPVIPAKLAEQVVAMRRNGWSIREARTT